MVHAVEFHTGVAQPEDFVCRLLRKAARLGARVLVTTPQAAELDRRLWTFEVGEFLPHARCPGSAPAVLQRSPVWLTPDVAAAEAARPAAVALPAVLVNLGAALAPDPLQFSRLIEVVGLDPDEAAAGRERWRAYKALGLAITHHPAAASQT